MSMIPTPNQISKVDKKPELKRTIEERNKRKQDNIIIIEVEEESSSSSLMSMHNTESNRKGSKVSSH